MLSSTSSAVATDPVRAAVRFPLHLSFVLCTDGQEYDAVTEDVSAAGLLFTAPAIPPIDSTVTIRITMPAAIMGANEDVLLECIGRIVRHDCRDGKYRAAAVIDHYSLKADHDES